MGSYVLNSKDQLNAYDGYINDPRGTISTGFSELDSLLRKGGLASSTLTLLGGRTGTRKTTTTANLMANMIDQGTAVGLVGLDGGLSNNYLGRLFSVWSGFTMEDIEAEWNTGDIEATKEAYQKWASNLSVYNGELRPSMADLTRWLAESESPSSGTVRPEVVFIDYVSLLHRQRWDGQENQRIHRLIEELQVWTHDHEVCTVAIHQVGRADEGVGIRYHGDTPMSLEGLKYGGEEIADIVLATYRPARDPIGNMEWDMARQVKGERFTKDDWQAAVERVNKYQDYTYLQLLKNRPGVHTNEKGIPLRSVLTTQKMVVDYSVSDISPIDVDPGDMEKAFGQETNTRSEANKTEDNAQADS